MISLIFATLFIGSHAQGEIEILADPMQVAAVEKIQTERFVKKGLSESAAQEASRVGIVAEDFYWIWERDAVIFPSGAVGTYNRLSWKNQGGVAVLPIFADGRIALNLNFRHATRSWEWELPRGGVRGGEEEEAAARRELIEETGLAVDRLSFLGCMAPDTGVLSTVVPIYAGWVREEGESNPEESEAIAGIYLFSIEELEKGLRNGYIEIEPKGKVPLRDSFLTFALFQLKNRAEENLIDGTR